MGTVSTSITEESNNSKNTLFTFDLDSSYIAVDPGVVSSRGLNSRYILKLDWKTLKTILGKLKCQIAKVSRVS